MKARLLMAVIAIAALLSAPLSSAANEKIGIFEMLRASEVSFDETTAALDAAIAVSDFILHGVHDVRVPEDRHRARVYVLSSPAYRAAAAGESTRTVSAQVLRLAVYTQGDEQRSYINMANPLAHAMVFYAGSARYDELLDAARNVTASLHELVAAVPGEPRDAQLAPLRSEKHYRKFKGDGPARMMAKFRNFEKSQLQIVADTADNFEAVVERVEAALAANAPGEVSRPQGWEQVAKIRLGEDAVYFGISNPYIEDKMVRINSRFRSDSKSDLSPYPGVDHVTALPAEVLVIREADRTRVLHYGQMWRMQLYFWDSGYRAFTANMGVPGAIVNSIEAAVRGE